MGGRKRPGAGTGRRLLGVEYAGQLEAIVFRFAHGQVAGLAIDRLDGLDPSPVSRVTLLDDGWGLLIEQFSGNSVELPAQALLDRDERVARAPSARYREPL